ncbi:MAG: hypothetical protein H7Y00_12660 [Fimbriimonadaceae bacterium]|nr:hypothetical protein [Chitinophagales bacterium]
MKKKTLFILAAFCIGFLIYSCSKSSAEESSGKKKVMSNDEMIARGKYIVSISGCNDCHTPKNMTAQGPVPDMTRMLSGHLAGDSIPSYDKTMVGTWILFSPGLTAYVGPWGVSYSANLTPSQSGLGN